MKKLLVLCLGLVMLLSACSAGGSSSSIAEDASSTVDGASVTNGESYEGKIVYWSMWNPTEPQGVVIKEAAEKFESEYPGTEIEIVFNGRENRNMVVPAIEGGQEIDLFDFTLDVILDQTSAFSGHLLALDEYMSMECPGGNGKTLEEELTPLFIESAREFAEDGKLYAIPYQPYVRAFMYNKEHFEKAGIDKVPETWDELLDACAKLKAAGYNPITTDDAYAYMNLGYQLCRYKGQQFVHDLVMGEESWEDEGVMQALKDYEELAKLGYFSPNVTSNVWPAGQQEMAAGTASMYVNGTFLVNEVMPATGPDFPWGVFAYPAVENGVEGTEANIYSAQSFAINKDIKNAELAMAFIAYMTTGEYDEKLAATTYGIPMGVDTPWPTQLEDAKKVIDETTIRYPAYTTIRDNADLQPVISSNFIKLIGGQITAEEFVEQMKM